MGLAGDAHEAHQQVEVREDQTGEHDAALAVAQRLAQNVRDLSLPHEASVHGVVTVSIGVATVEPSDTSSPAALLAAADEALRLAKGAGRNRVAGRHAR